MNKTQAAALKRAINAQQAFATLYRARFVHIIQHDCIVVPQTTLELIEPDPQNWDYRRTQDGKAWWATAYFNSVRFEALLSDAAHLDLGGHGIQ